MLRVLVVTPGCDRSEKAIYQGLVNAGFMLDLLCDPQSPNQEDLARMGIRVQHLIVRNRIDFKAIRSIRRLLHETPYDIIYAPRNHTLSVSLLAARGFNIKHVAYRGTSGHLSRLDPASWLTYLNPKIDKIICVSHSVRHYLMSMGLPSHRLITIHKGHDINWYQGHTPPDLIRFGIPENAFVVGFIGNVRPVKGVDVLLEAVRHIPADLLVHLLIFGNVHDKRIEKLAYHPDIRDRVHLAGFHPKAAVMAGAFDIFVMPSLEREGLPRAVIEAMAQGIPAVVTDVGGMPEIVVNGECGLVVPPNDPEALSQAIISLAKDTSLCRRFSDNAPMRIRDHFNIQATIRETVDLFHRLLSETAESPEIVD